MGDVLQLENTRQVQEEATRWLSRLDRGLTDAERVELDAWLQADPRHVSHFVDLAKVWDKLEGLNVLSGLVELPPARSHRPPLSKRRWVAAAACLMTLVTFAIWSRAHFDGRDSHSSANAVSALASRVPADNPSSTTSFSTDTGELRRVFLSDGTVVEMNTRSSIAVRIGAKERRVELQTGEATFKVAHDSNRPFIVHAAGRSIRAVGTVFTVRAKSNDNVAVIVSEGRVAVTRAGNVPDGDADAATSSTRSTRLLEAGDRLEITGAGSQFDRLSASDVDDALAWQNGMIVFQGESLVDALGEVSRYSDARFELADESIGYMHVAGVYQIRDLNGFVDSLRVNLGIGARQLSDGTLSLYRLRPSNGDPPTM